MRTKSINMAIKPGDMHWYCKEYDCNANIIKDIDILKYREEDIKKMKKKSNSKEEFEELLKREMMYRYWSRCEHELIIQVDFESVWLIPWVGCRNPEEVKIDVRADNTIDWRTFAEYHIGKQIYKTKAKIDVFDQLQWRWDEFVSYCYDFHHKWQRRKDEV